MADNASTLMSPAEMKPLLLLSKREPVFCAVALSKDKQGLILLDKRTKARKLAAVLKSTAAEKKIDLDLATVRFGTASVDTEKDASLVAFKVNKEPSAALRPKLLEQLKRAGFTKCNIAVDAALETEGGDSPAKDEGNAPAKDANAVAGQIHSGVNGTADNGAAGDQQDAGPAPHEPVGPTANSDPSKDGPNPSEGQTAPEITRRLTGLVKRMLPMLAFNPLNAGAMKQAAQGAQAALKSGDLQTAATQIDALESLLGQSGPGTSANAAGPRAGSPVFDKSRLIWTATRQKVEQQFDTLSSALQASFKDQPYVAEIEKAFRGKVEPIMAKFDASLSEKLAHISQNGGGEDHAKLVADAKQTVESYKSYLGGEPLIAKLDSNPFAPITIGQTVSISLDTLLKALG